MTELRVLVTGGGRGIGRAIALRFAREGASVVVAARTSAQLDAVVGEIEKAGGRGLAAQMNVSDHGSVEAAVWRAVEFCGGTLDVLVNNAGTFDLKPIGAMRVPDWSVAIETNLTGPFLVTLEALDHLAESERGHVFNVASKAAKQGFPGATAYCASKYGLRGFSDALREDLRPKAIRVTTVYPGGVDTSIWDGVEGQFDRSRMLKPEAVADAVLAAYRAGPDAKIDDVDVLGAYDGVA
ncbi:MAG TPA: SDR family oxidoreductase [Planctomycetota bacterium]|nr:SDR family oxidoreductase [Planctomycetota bacterium]